MTYGLYYNEKFVNILLRAYEHLESVMRDSFIRGLYQTTCAHLTHGHQRGET